MGWKHPHPAEDGYAWFASALDGVVAAASALDGVVAAAAQVEEAVPVVEPVNAMDTEPESDAKDAESASESEQEEAPVAPAVDMVVCPRRGFYVQVGEERTSQYTGVHDEPDVRPTDLGPNDKWDEYANRWRDMTQVIYPVPRWIYNRDTDFFEPPKP
jgi:hypothetical protein